MNSSPVVWDPDGNPQTIYDCSERVECPVSLIDVNGTGEVIGNKTGRPFRWTSEEGFRDLLGDASGVVFGVNERGEVAGAVEYPLALPTIWDRNDYMRGLPLPGARGVGAVHSINNKGQAVGVVR